MEALSRNEVSSRRRILRRTMLVGSACLALIGWLLAVVLVRFSDHPAADAMAGVHGSPLGALTPLMMLVASGMLAALVMLMVVLDVIWRIRLALPVKLVLTLVMLGAGWGMFTVTIVAGLYAAGTGIEEMGGARRGARDTVK